MVAAAVRGVAARLRAVRAGRLLEATRVRPPQACLPPTECRSVPGCDACTAAGAACVRNDLMVASVGCVDPGDCEQGNLCECLDACTVGCAEQETGVSCYCPGC